MSTYEAFTPFGWPIVIYLMLAGLACGASLCAVLFLNNGKKVDDVWASFDIAKTALSVAVGAIAIGILWLLFDLQNPSNLYLNFLEFNPSSAIAWGTRIITLFVMLCIYSLVLINTKSGEDKKPIGPLLMGLLIFFALAIGIYPAFVLGQADIARPLWEPWLLAPLFLLLGVHSGFALVQLLTYDRWSEENLEKIRKLDLGAIVIQIGLFILLISVTSFSALGKERLFFGEFALWFWIGVVFIAWVLPFILNVSSLSKNRILILSQICFLCGAFVLRAVIVFSGQGTQAFVGT